MLTAAAATVAAAAITAAIAVSVAAAVAAASVAAAVAATFTSTTTHRWVLATATVPAALGAAERRSRASRVVRTQEANACARQPTTRALRGARPYLPEPLARRVEAGRWPPPHHPQIEPAHGAASLACLPFARARRERRTRRTS